MKAFFHVWMTNNWQELVTDQLQDFACSGLARQCPIEIGAIGTAEDCAMLCCISERLAPFSKVTYHGSEPTMYEFPTLEMLQEYCRCAGTDEVLYFHTKGISQPDNPLQDYWRETMTDFVMYDWEECVNRIRRGADLAACKFKITSHEIDYYAGNFWWADAKFIRRLPNFQKPHRYEAESWVARANPPPKVFEKVIAEPLF